MANEKGSKLPEEAQLQYVVRHESPPGTAPAEAFAGPAIPPPTSYGNAFSEDDKDEEGKEKAPAWERWSDGKPPAPGPVAIIVCHGMGQQVRFETLGALAESLARNLTAANNIVTKGKLDRPVEEFITHAEISWDDLSAGADPIRRKVHLYEAYWAPLTEGVITYTETLWFLSCAAGRGIRDSIFPKSTAGPGGARNTFDRWMFGRLVPCTIGAGTASMLLVTFVALVAVVLFILIFGLVASRAIKAFAEGTFTWHSLAHLVLPFVVQGRSALFGYGLSIGFWVLVGLSVWLRDVVVQYVGDVTVYIAPFKASKFYKVRNEIQKVGFDVASLVYGFSAKPASHYKKVIMVGHSLGSVLAYDTLNAMINLDQVRPPAQRLDVRGRTASLITFGSPLNKTAFLFRTQPNNVKNPLREQMVAASQPLIATYAARANHFKWINIHAPADIISGPLTYYDDLTNPLFTPAKHIVDLIDPQATTLLAAHVQYWENPMLSAQLIAEVTK